MKKSKLFLTGIPVLALVFAFVVAGCGSSPKAPAGGQAATPDLTGVTSYYVRADGDDKNAGTSGGGCGKDGGEEDHGYRDIGRKNYD